MANFDFKETFLNPIFKGNPISVLVLGICSSLAVTVQLKGALVMGLSVIIVTGLSSLICSLLRNTIPNRIRIIVQLVVVAMMVILVDQVLKAYAYSVSKTLSVYIGLIISIISFIPCSTTNSFCKINNNITPSCRKASWGVLLQCKMFFLTVR